jgi:polyhydroxyalkanoate synthesis regulator phasin
MPTGKPAPDTAPSLMEQLLARTPDPLGVVMLTRERIQETLEEAVQRGRVTRTDANDLVGELLRRGRQQTEELLSDLERTLDSGRDRMQSASGKRSRLTESVSRLARTAEAARRTMSSSGPAIAGYDELTARQVQARLGALSPAQLREVGDYERRHANRKTVLDAVRRALG